MIFTFYTPLSLMWLCEALGMKSVRNDQKYALSFPIISFLLGNDSSKTMLITKNWYIGNETIWSKICRYRSITVPQIESTETMNGRTYMQHVHNQMSDQQSNMNITAPYAHTITICDKQLLNFAANRFLSQQPTYRLGCWRRSSSRAGDCEWRIKVYT
jgi:hypothetical protein